MHELSLALEICHMAEQRLGPAALPQLVEVGLEIGDEAGVEPSSLEFCLEALLREPPFTRPRVVLQRCRGDVLAFRYLEVDDGRPDD
jgi:Zn finger protein HypA/HybF involved in hydrogenase expression